MKFRTLHIAIVACLAVLSVIYIEKERGLGMDARSLSDEEACSAVLSAMERGIEVGKFFTDGAAENFPEGRLRKRSFMSRLIRPDASRH